MAGAKHSLAKTKRGDSRFFDAEEQEFIESFEEALERGDVQPNTPDELAKARSQWKEVAQASQSDRAISLRLGVRELELIKAIARRRGVSYQTLMISVLHQFALDAQRESS